MRIYHKQRYRAGTNILLSCEHAGGLIPKEYKQLGLTKKQLREAEGDWYDIGSLELTKHIANELDLSYIYTPISRLVIDHNRDINSKTIKKNRYHAALVKQELLMEKNGIESKVIIPGNAKNHDKEQKKRFKKYVLPYRNDGEKIINKILATHNTAFIISIHTLHPIYNGQKRDIDIDVLSRNKNKSMKIAKSVIKSLKSMSSLNIAYNKPWSLNEIDGGLWGDIANGNNIIHIGIDIKSSCLSNETKRKQIGSILTKALLKESSFDLS